MAMGAAADVVAMLAAGEWTRDELAEFLWILAAKITTQTPGPKAKKPRAGHCVPEDFVLTEELAAFGLNDGLSQQQVQREFEKFRDYQFKNGHTDWKKTWRNWVRTAVDRLPKNGNFRPQTAAGRSMESIRIAAERMGIKPPGGLDDPRRVDECGSLSDRGASGPSVGAGNGATLLPRNP